MPTISSTLALTGASSVTLGTSAAAASIANVTTGNAATSIADSNTGTLKVNAGALAAGTPFTLSGSEKIHRDRLYQGNLAVTNETGTLNVTTAAASALSIATGGGAEHDHGFRHDTGRDAGAHRQPCRDCCRRRQSCGERLHG